MRITPIKTYLKNGEQVTIREVEVADAEDLLEMMRSCVETSDFLLSIAEEVDFTIEQEKAWIQSSIDTQGVLLLVAEIDGEIVGDIEVRAGSHKKTAHVGSVGITIVEKYRSKGLSSELFKIILSELERKTDLEILRLSVFSRNKLAIALYEKFGFEVEGIFKDSFKQKDGHYEYEIVMSLKIKTLRNKTN